MVLASVVGKEGEEGGGAALLQYLTPMLAWQPSLSGDRRN
jgi:hypothetical protein